MPFVHFILNYSKEGPDVVMFSEAFIGGTLWLAFVVFAAKGHDGAGDLGFCERQ